MNYQNIYNKIIENRINNPLNKEIYGEIHHIIPRCLGGNDEKENLIKLTAREHFLCHYCLVKIYEGKSEYHKMLNAFIIMKAGSKSGLHQGQRYINSRLYESLRKEFAKKQSEKLIGEKNPNFGTCWIKNFELKKSILINKIEIEKYLEKGWEKGRVTNFLLLEERKNKKRANIEFERKRKKDKKEKNIAKNHEMKKQELEILYKIYKENNKRFKKFVEVSGWNKSYSSLINLFKYYL